MESLICGKRLLQCTKRDQSYFASIDCLNITFFPLVWQQRNSKHPSWNRRGIYVMLYYYVMLLCYIIYVIYIMRRMYWNFVRTYMHSQYWYFIREWRIHSITAAKDFPLRDKIMGGYRKYISDKKQISYILAQNGIAIMVHFKFFRVWECLGITQYIVNYRQRKRIENWLWISHEFR